MTDQPNTPLTTAAIQTELQRFRDVRNAGSTQPDQLATNAAQLRAYLAALLPRATRRLHALPETHPLWERHFTSLSYAQAALDDELEAKLPANVRHWAVARACERLLDALPPGNLT